MGIDPVSIAITLALNAAMMALTMSRTIEGPRLKDLSATVADYGTPLNYFIGQCRLTGAAFFCEPIKEKKKKRKGKGGKYKDYTYFGTWAVVIADHEISAVKKIWFDKHLVYDVDQGGAIFALSQNYEIANAIRFYLGTETQEPDPRMLATIEAKEGADMCPAYLGVSYVFFEDIPLEKLGNRFPNVEVEAANGGGISYPKEEIFFTDYLWSADKMFRDQDFTYGLAGQGPVGGNVFDTTMTIIDMNSRTEIYSAPNTYTWSYSGISSFGNKVMFHGIDSSGSMWGTDYYVGSNSYRLLIEVQNFGAGPVIVHGQWSGTGRVQSDQFLCCDLPGGGGAVVLLGTDGKMHSFDGSSISDYTPSAGRKYTNAFFQDEYGDVWSGTIPSSGTLDNIEFVRLIANGSSPIVSGTVSVTGLSNLSSGIPKAFYADGHFILFWPGSARYLYRIDANTGSLVQSESITDYFMPTGYVRPNSEKFALEGLTFGDFDLYTTSDFSIFASYSASSWTSTGTYSYPPLADTINIIDYDNIAEAWIGHGYSSSDHIYTSLGWYDLPVPSTVTLKTLVDNISERVGLDLAYVETDAIGTTG